MVYDSGMFGRYQLEDWPIMALELAPIAYALRCHGSSWAGMTLVTGIYNAGCTMSINALRGKYLHTRMLMKKVADLVIEHDIVILM